VAAIAMANNVVDVVVDLSLQLACFSTTWQLSGVKSLITGGTFTVFGKSLFIFGISPCISHQSCQVCTKGATDETTVNLSLGLPP